MAGRHKLIRDRLRRPYRDREPDPLCLHSRLGLAGDERVDPDHLAVEVHQWAAGIARVDRRIGLDHIEQIRALAVLIAAWLLDSTPQRAHHADAHCWPAL